MATPNEGIKSLYGVSVYPNATYIMLGFVLNMFLGFIFWVVVARFYTPADFELAAVIFIAGISFWLLIFKRNEEIPTF